RRAGTTSARSAHAAAGDRRRDRRTLRPPGFGVADPMANVPGPCRESWFEFPHSRSLWQRDPLPIASIDVERQPTTTAATDLAKPSSTSSTLVVAPTTPPMAKSLDTLYCATVVPCASCNETVASMTI